MAYHFSLRVSYENTADYFHANSEPVSYSFLDCYIQ